MSSSRKIAPVLLAGATVLAAFGTQAVRPIVSSASSPRAASITCDEKNPPTSAVPMATLMYCAKKEGEVHGFGYDPTWAHEIGLYQAMQKNYGVKFVGQAEALWTSAQELGGFLNQQDNPQGDIAEVGLKWGPIGATAGAYAVYRHSHWNDIPANLRAADGTWSCGYYGVIGLEINTDKVKVIPQHWNDLLKPIYRGLVAVDDPRGANQGVQTVLAVNYALGGSLSNLDPGIKYFAQLKKSGNFIGVRPLPGPIASGNAAISFRWSYNAIADIARYHGNPHIKVVVPSEGTAGGPYCEVINKLAPHPYAARLAEEWLMSDEGQTNWATGYTYPLVKGAKIPSGVTKALPPLPSKVAIYSDANALVAATSSLSQRWNTEVLSQ